MKFNTQISTSVEQSRLLIVLGLKKETADMVWMAEMGYDAENFRTYDTGDYFLRPIDYLEGEEHRDNVPAWSLHRLIAMCPDFVVLDSRRDCNCKIRNRMNLLDLCQLSFLITGFYIEYETRASKESR